MTTELDLNLYGFALVVIMAIVGSYYVLNLIINKIIDIYKGIK